ncbi:MAG: hypothetical protein ACRELF_04740 [Gemmataceae bacterium]
MRGNGFSVALLAAAGVLAWSGASRGGDTIRLNGTASTPTRTLADDGQGADTIRVWHHGFGFGGYRGFGFGGYRGFGYGGLYRPYYGFGLGYGGLYRPYYGLGLGYGRFGYGGLGGYGLGYGLGYGGLGGYGLGYGMGYGGLGGYGLGYGGYGLGYGGYGIGYGGFFGPCAGATAGVYTLSMPAATLGTPLPALVQPGTTDRVPRMPRSDGTYPYDGGPRNPVPNLKETPPSSTTPRSVPLEGRSVSLPKATPKWRYPAYGENARRLAPASERTYLTRGESKKIGSH